MLVWKYGIQTPPIATSVSVCLMTTFSVNEEMQKLLAIAALPAVNAVGEEVVVCEAGICIHVDGA